MRKIVPINNRKFLSNYNSSGTGKYIPETLFAAGVILCMSPQFINFAYSGLVSTFAGVFLTGSVVGLAIYYKLPYRIISIKPETATQTPTREDTPLRKAA